MTTTTLISVDEYLRSDYEPDADFVDGMIEERPMGETDHNRLQRKFLFLLNTPETGPYFECIQEQRVRVSATRFRIPDLALIRADAPEEQITTVAPLLCIEVQSPEDRLSRTLVRARDFARMGVPEVWIFDPERRSARVFDGAELSEERTEGTLTVPGTPVTVSVVEVFSALDVRRRAR